MLRLACFVLALSCSAAHSDPKAGLACDLAKRILLSQIDTTKKLWTLSQVEVATQRDNNLAKSRLAMIQQSVSELIAYSKALVALCGKG